MEYRRVGKSGLQISLLSFGSWLTFGSSLDIKLTERCMKYAFEQGVNFFDNAEVYADGVSEAIMGKILPSFNRMDVVVSTKIFWGGEGPNRVGLSRKHLVEGTKASLKRLDLDYVDILYCHRPDPETPVEETVFAMNDLIRWGHTLYWGTSEWSADEIKQAHKTAKENNLIGPIVEQPLYNMLVREKVEHDFSDLYDTVGLGLTTFSPLASGILTGKYNNGIPENSRLAQVGWLKQLEKKNGHLNQEVFDKIDKLDQFARNFGFKAHHLAIAWVMKNPRVSSVILGASRFPQLKDNLTAFDLYGKMKESDWAEVENMIG
ncbi:MAG: aldo/keto reductase [Spirochaetales bacterium]|nr:aldo/keto reductase [Spirochaetales bacterium]